MDDKHQDYSKKTQHYSPRLQKSYDSTTFNEKNQNKQQYTYEGDSLPINEQKFAKLKKIFNDALADFTTPTDLEDYNMNGRESTSSQTRGYRDRKLSGDGYSPGSYRKHYQPVDASYNKYYYSNERRPSQPEFDDIPIHNTIDRTSSEVSPKSYAAFQQRRYDRIKSNEYYARSGKYPAKSSGNILVL